MPIVDIDELEGQQPQQALRSAPVYAPAYLREPEQPIGQVVDIEALGLSDKDVGDEIALQAAAHRYNQENPGKEITSADLPDRSGVTGAAKDLFYGAIDAVRDQFPEDMGRIWRGGKIQLGEEGIIQEQQRDSASRIPSRQVVLNEGPNRSLYLGPRSVATSAVVGATGGILGGMAGSAVAPGPGTAAGTIGGMLGAGGLTGTAFFRLAKDSFLEEIVNRAAKENPNITQEEVNALLVEYDELGTQSGLWEAGPEAASQALTVGLFGPMGNKLISPALKKIAPKLAESVIARTATKFGLEVGEEEVTEFITYLGQEAARQKAGLRQDDPSLGEFAKEQAGPVAVGSLFQGSLHALGQKALAHVLPKKDATDHDLLDNGNAATDERTQLAEILRQQRQNGVNVQAPPQAPQAIAALPAPERRALPAPAAPYRDETGTTILPSGGPTEMGGAIPMGMTRDGQYQWLSNQEEGRSPGSIEPAIRSTMYDADNVPTAAGGQPAGPNVTFAEDGIESSVANQGRAISQQTPTDEQKAAIRALMERRDTQARGQGERVPVGRQAPNILYAEEEGIGGVGQTPASTNPQEISNKLADKEVSADLPSAGTVTAPLGEASQKQPWEMGRDEFIGDTGGKFQDTLRRASYWSHDAKRRKEAESIAKEHDRKSSNHLVSVRQAISEGKPVPAAVLQEYAGEEWADRAIADQKPSLPEANKPETATNKENLSVEKQPWEMTREEYDNEEFVLYNFPTQKNSIEEARPFIDRKTGDGTYPADAKWTIEEINGERRLVARGRKTRSSHESVLRKALSEGKPVPAAILQDYAGEEWADKALSKKGKEVAPKQASPNYSDPRLKRKDFRDIIGGYTDSITTAGKNPTSFIDLGAEGTQVIRHGSVHPPLIQKAIATAGSVKDLRNAVRKAANGDKLGTRQAEAVKLVLDQMQEEVNLVREGEVRNVRGKQTELRKRRDAYRETAQPATGEELEATRNSGENAQAEQISDDFYIPPAEEANEYPAEWDAETKTPADLYAEARKYDNEAAESLLESQAEDSEIATQLWEIIQDGRKGEGSSQVVQGEGFSLKGEAQKRQAREEEQLGLSGIKAARPEFGKRPDLDKGRENVERLPLADEIAEKEADAARQDLFGVADQNPASATDKEGRVAPVSDKIKPDAPISRTAHDVSVDDTIYLQDVYENKRHPVNFRGWVDNDTAMVIYNGWQMSFDRERLFKNDLASNDVASASDKKTTKESIPTVIDSTSSFYDFFARLHKGEATVDEYKTAYQSLTENKEKILEELNGLSKEKLLKEFPGLWIRRADKKASLVNAAYRDMGEAFSLQRVLSWTMGENSEIAVKKLVESTTEKDLSEFAEARKRAKEERQKKREETKKAVENPQTLEDFDLYVRAQKADGKTSREAWMSLSPEQRAKYDELAAEKTRDERKETKEERQSQLATAQQAVSGQIIETKHTKKGHDIFVVQLSERVERDDFNALSASAKKLGGYYSSYRGNGAIPGFTFTERQNANAFLDLAGGDTQAAQETVKARKDAFADDRSQSAVERLRAMAETLEERADDILSQDRKVNTDRRARMAANAEAAAHADQALAKTMRNIADAIENGDAKFLDRVRQKSQVELLQRMIKTAQNEEVRDKHKSYADQEQHRYDPPTNETVDYSEWPTYTAYRSDLASLGRKLLSVDGLKSLGQRLMKVADDVTDAYLKFAKENLYKISTFTKKDGSLATFTSRAAAEASINRSGYRGQAIPFSVSRGEYIIITSPSEAISRGIWDGDNDKRITLAPDFAEELIAKVGRKDKSISIPYQFENTRGKRAALKRMGIETNAEMRSALREFINLSVAPAQEDKIKKMERAMVGRTKDGLDFFPTPQNVANEMIEAADVQEGMAVLEPSAGMGHIAEQIRENGVEPDVVEMSNDRKELLDAKGFNVIGRDFLEVQGEYDRIIMNPPFSQRRDAAHVQHAYSLLKPNGRIVALMGEGVFFGQDKKAQDFRTWLESVGGTSEKLAEGTFLDPSLPVNTGVNGRMVIIDKTGTEARFSFADTEDTNAKEDVDRLKNRIKTLESHLGKIVSGWKNKPKVKVIGSESELPQTVQNDILNAKAQGRVRGVYHNGTVYLVVENLTNLQEAEEVLLHEALGHYGLEQVFGKELKQALNQLYLALGGDKGILRLAEKYGVNIDPYLDPEKSAHLSDRNRNAMIVNELLAHIAPQKPHQTLIKKVIAAIRNGLRRLGLGNLLKLSDGDILDLVARARDAVVKGEAGTFVVHDTATETAASGLFSLAGTKTQEGEPTVQQKNHANGIIDRLRNYLDNPGGLGRLPNWTKYLAQRYRTLGTLGQVKDGARRVYNMLNGAPKETSQKIYEFMTTKDADPAMVPERWRRQAVEAKQIVVNIGNNLVAYGLLDEETFEANKGGYLPAVYLKHLLGEKLFKALGAGKTLSDMGYTKRKHLEEDLLKRGLPKDEVDTIINVVMGKVKDPAYLVARAFSIPQRDMAILDWLGQIAKNAEWVLPKILVDWTTQKDPMKQIGKVRYKKNADGTYDIKQTKTRTVEAKHRNIRGADLDTFLGNADLATFVRAGKGRVIQRKEEVNGKPIYKPTPWKKLGRLQYRVNADGTYNFVVKELVTSEENQRGVAESDLDTVVSEKKADAIRSDKGRIAGGMRVTSYWLKNEADRLEKQAPHLPESDRAKALEIAQEMRSAANAAMQEAGIEDTASIPSEFRQIPNTARYGPLRGMIVRREIYNDLVGTVHMTVGEQSAAEKILGSGGVMAKINGLWKWSKVAANVAGQVRNMVSNMVLLNMSGVNNPMVVIQALKEIRSNGQHWRIAKKYGVKEASFSNNELARIETEMMDAVTKEQGGWFGLFGTMITSLAKGNFGGAKDAGKGIGQKALSTGGKVVNATGDVYQFMEALGKTAKIIDEMNKGKSAEEASMEAHKWLFDYSLVGPNVKYLRNAPMGMPFLTFSTKILPRLIEVATTKPWRLAPYVAMHYGMQALVTSMFDIDDDDLDKIKKMLPEWIREKQHVYIMPMKDGRGRWQALDLGYFFPWTQWTEFAEALAKGDIKGALRDFPFTFGGPLPDLHTAIMTNKDSFTGRDIVDPLGTPSEQAGQIFGYLYDMAAPPWLTDRGFVGKMHDAMTSKVDMDKRGNVTPTMGQAALRLVGANTYGYDPKLTRVQNLKRMKFEAAQLKTKMKRELRDQNLDQEKRGRIKEQYMDRIQRLNREILRYASETKTNALSDD